MSKQTIDVLVDALQRARWHVALDVADTKQCGTPPEWAETLKMVDAALAAVSEPEWHKRLPPDLRRHRPDCEKLQPWVEHDCTCGADDAPSQQWMVLGVFVDSMPEIARFATEVEARVVYAQWCQNWSDVWLLSVHEGPRDRALGAPAS